MPSRAHTRTRAKANEPTASPTMSAQSSILPASTSPILMPTSTSSKPSPNVSPLPYSSSADENPSPSSTTAPQQPCSRFVGTVCNFLDGSSWMIGQPLSWVKLQQTFTPCEATQVFVCTCLEDLHGRYGDKKEAVIKIKFQFVS